MIKYLKYLIIPCIAWLFYSGLLTCGDSVRNNSQNYNYFNTQAISYLQGRLDVDCPTDNCHDLVKFQGKYYLYWPPTPALVIYTPLVALLGEELPDQLIVSIIGAINVFIFSLLLLYFGKRFDIPLKFRDNAFITIFWGLGTVHFYMSMLATVWTTSQVIAQLFLLTSCMLLLRAKQNSGLFLSGIFFGLACYTRNNLVFYGLFFMTMMWFLWKDDPWKKKISQLILFGIPFVIFSFINLYYNFLRFGEFTENGLQYHNMSANLLPIFEKYGYFSWHYFQHNVWTEIFSPPPFVDTFPFFNILPERYGFGLLWASPLLLFFFVSLFYFVTSCFKEEKKSKLKQKDLIIMASMLISFSLVSIVILLIMSPGWLQFASRYSLDYQLLLFLFTLYLYKIWKGNIALKIICALLLLLAIYMNYYGAHQFVCLDIYQ